MPLSRKDLQHVVVIPTAAATLHGNAVFLGMLLEQRHGGQPGHEKHERPLIPTDQCDDVQRLRLAECRRCGGKLSGYRQSPTLRRKAALERDFERLFRRRTGFGELNETLRRIHAKRADLLLVLERPEIPLHNNLSVSDIWEWAKRRKISAGTRSELGRRCRDTFVSLKKTCRKLGVSFWRYLQDRIRGADAIFALPELMRQASAEP